MPRRSLRLAVVALAIFALAACEISIGPGPFTPAIEGTYTARIQTSPTALRTNVPIAQGETLFFRIDMPDGALDLLYGEVVGTGLRVSWLSTTGATLAVSQSRDFFAGSVGALATTAAEDSQDAVAPRSVGERYVCVGPCAAIAPTASGYRYLAVRNITNDPRSFDLFAYTMNANDSEDREGNSNDTAATATPFGAGVDLEGAIELLDDRDWFEYVGFSERIITFIVADGSEGVGLRLRFEGQVNSLSSGATAVLRNGDRFEVYSSLGRAGPAGSALYFIIQND